MSYGCVALVSVSKLSPEQVQLGIEIGAEKNYQERMCALQYSDWSAATKKVATAANPSPKDDDIRPVAKMFYRDRILGNANGFCAHAMDRLVKDGNEYPTAEQVLAAALELCRDKVRVEKDQDWLKAEASAKHGFVWQPF